MNSPLEEYGLPTLDAKQRTHQVEILIDALLFRLPHEIRLGLNRASAATNDDEHFDILHNLKTDIIEISKDDIQYPAEWEYWAGPKCYCALCGDKVGAVAGIERHLSGTYGLSCDVMEVLKRYAREQYVRRRRQQRALEKRKADCLANATELFQRDLLQDPELPFHGLRFSRERDNTWAKDRLGSLGFHKVEISKENTPSIVTWERLVGSLHIIAWPWSDQKISFHVLPWNVAKSQSVLKALKSRATKSPGFSISDRAKRDIGKLFARRVLQCLPDLQDLGLSVPDASKLQNVKISSDISPDELARLATERAPDGYLISIIP